MTKLDDPTLMWWIDAVGGFLVFQKSRIQIGQSGVAENDLKFLANISAHHADLLRTAEGNMLLAQSETRVNNRVGERFLLRHGDLIQMRSLQLRYYQPVSWSNTARLVVESSHRLPLSLDGVILLGQNGVLGAGTQAHIPTSWADTLTLTRRRGELWIRSSAPLRVGETLSTGWCLFPLEGEVSGDWGRWRSELAKI